MFNPLLKCEALPEFHDNYLWTLSNTHGQALVVDPGDAQIILQKMREGLKPVAIFITHHHPDHIGGLAELLQHCQVPVYAPEESRIPFASHHVQHDDNIFLEAMNLHFNVIAVPGHTRSHIAYCGGDYLFCGDTLFSLGCGRLYEGSAKQMLQSLDLLSALPMHTKICCSHEYTLSNAAFAEVAEPDNSERDELVRQIRETRAQNLPSLPSRLDIELACNPFLRSDKSELWPYWSRQSGLVIQNRLQAFTALRAWKDNFRL
jgi:hydroxyacylglutathione hydrolase